MKILLFCSSLLLLTLNSSAQVLLKNINASNGDLLGKYDYPSNTKINNNLFFVGSDSSSKELWKLSLIDNSVVKVLTTGDLPIKPNQKIGVFNGKLIVMDYNGKIWLVSDENPSSNVLLNQLNGPDYNEEGFKTGKFLIVGNKCFFTVGTSSTGQELFCTDGTAGGSYLIDLIPGTTSSFPQNFIEFQGKLFFSFQTPSNTKLYSSDGTPSGTVLVKDFVRFWGHNNITLMTKFDNKLFIRVIENSESNFYYSSWGNGDPILTLPNSYIIAPFEYDNTIYFSAGFNKTWKYINGVLVSLNLTSLDGSERSCTNLNNDLIYSIKSNTWSIWKFNGTTVTKVFPTTTFNSSYSYYTYFRKIGNDEILIVFFIYTSTNFRSELWKMNINTFVSTKLSDLAPLTNSTPSSRHDLIKDKGELVFLNGKYYFIYNDFVSDYSLWSTDLTPQGTTKIQTLGVKDIDDDFLSGKDNYYNNFKDLDVVEGKLFFKTMNVPSKEWSLVLLDTSTGQSKLLDDCTGGIEIGLDIKIHNTNSKVYFMATSLDKGAEIWKYENGQSVMVNDINTKVGKSKSSSPTNFIRFNNALYFVAKDDLHGKELWKTDGTNAGTNLFVDFTPKYSFQ